MAGAGTGYPIWFMCSKLRLVWPRTEADHARHVTTLTGRTRATKRNGKGHARKSWTTREYRCSCGHVGWSSHIDLERQEARAGR